MWIHEVEDEAALTTAEETENPTPTADETIDSTSVETGSITSPDNLTTIIETCNIYLKRKYVSTFGESTFVSDFKQAKKKFNLVPSNKIKVVFLGEPAVDEGGPRREFFSGNLIYVDRCLIAIRSLAK